MIDAQTYLEHIRRDGVRIGDVAEGHLDVEVPTCPGNTVGSLLLHTMAVCAFWTGVLEQNRMPEGDMPNFGDDPLDAHRRAFEGFVERLGGRDPDESTWTWAGEGKVRFWYRRAAQEFAVHRWDFENAVGNPAAIDPTLAVDGIDEILFVFGPATGLEEHRGASERFSGNGETFRLEPTDLPDAITFTAHPDRFEYDGAASPGVTARGTASDLLLLLWGRVPSSALDVSGDASLLDRWQGRVKI